MTLPNFEAFAAPGVDDDNYDDEDELSPMFAALKSEDADLKVVLDSTTAKEAVGELILRKGDDEAIQDGGAAFVRLSGAVAKTPTTPWAATDGFKATITYTFEPSTYTKNVTLTSAGDATTVVAGSTLGVSVDLPEGVTSVSDVKWTSSSTTYVTVTEGSVSNGKLTATLNGAKSGTTIAKISVTFVGNDGITYQSDELSIKCVAS